MITSIANDLDFVSVEFSNGEILPVAEAGGWLSHFGAWWWEETEEKPEKCERVWPQMYIIRQDLRVPTFLYFGSKTVYLNSACGSPLIIFHR